MRCSISLWRDWRTFRAIIQDRNQGTCYITGPSTHLLREMIESYFTNASTLISCFNTVEHKTSNKFRHNACTVWYFIPWCFVYVSMFCLLTIDYRDMYLDLSINTVAKCHACYMTRLTEASAVLFRCVIARFRRLIYVLITVF